MSKKKSNNNSDMLDENVTKSNESKPTSGKEVSLKEYSKTASYSFNAKHYKLLLIGLGINILGFILMMGGAAEDPATFDAGELFSHTRITVAPLFIVLGYLVIMYAIMKRPKADQE
jgi:uncharacterized integral membrane protein